MSRPVRISAFTADAIAAAAESWGNGLDRSGSVRHADGSWTIQLEDDVLEALALIDPDPEVAIRRALGVPGSQVGRA